MDCQAVKEWKVYLIKCQTPNHYYIGMTYCVPLRVHQHVTGEFFLHSGIVPGGNPFTRKHGVKRVYVSVDTFTTEKAALTAENNYAQFIESTGRIAAGGRLSLASKDKRLSWYMDNPDMVKSYKLKVEPWPHMKALRAALRRPWKDRELTVDGTTYRLR